MRSTRKYSATLLTSCSIAISCLSVMQGGELFPRNTEVPFCYVHGAIRTWPVIEGKREGAVQLVARAEERILAEGEMLTFEGLQITITRDGLLSIQSDPDLEPISFELEVRLADHSNGMKTQRLQVQVAPPPRPISYVADLVDDLIHTYWDTTNHQFRPISVDGFHQYFRRLQAHGVNRLIVWQSPFPFMSDPQEFSVEDWQRYESQARAIVDSKELADAMAGNHGLQAWEWLREILALRLRSEFGRMFSDSAKQHGISLTASFRPFENALTKYYEVPAFNADGEFLWGFLPLASPVVNYHPDQTGFAHFREILARMGKSEFGDLDAIEVSGVDQAAQLVERFQAGHRDFVITVRQFPPLDNDSFVLMHGEDEDFSLSRVRDVRETIESRCDHLTDYELVAPDATTLRITNLTVPADCRFLLLSAATEFGRSTQLPADAGLSLSAKAGNGLGRGANIYWALDESDPEGHSTQVGGILADGEFRTEFQATENSIKTLVNRKVDKLKLGNNQLVIDCGRRWEVEMVDFSQAAARGYAVRQLRTLLSYEAFDEILINTRTHTDLAGSFADGIDGIKPVFHYRQAGHHRGGNQTGPNTFLLLGIADAYAPIHVADQPSLQELAADVDLVEQLTTSQPGEWSGSCQSPDTPYLWRFQRNSAVAEGVRRLLSDLEQAFPDTRIRAVIPQRAAVDEGMKLGLAVMKKPDCEVYGSEYYRHVWNTNNFTFRTCEGMAMLDLSGLRVEPVFLGIRYIPEDGPLKLFVDLCIDDLQENHGSRFSGPRSFFYEAQETLRGDNRDEASTRRQEIIRRLLSHRKHISEVLLYEAADWTSHLPLDNPHAYLDCPHSEAWLQEIPEIDH